MMFRVVRLVYLFGWLFFLTAGDSKAVAIEVQRTTLPSTFGATGFQTIDFVSDVFVSAGVTPLVFVIPTTVGGNPCTIRFEDVRQDGFDAVCAEAPGEDGPHLAMDLHYIAIAPGVHTIPATVGGMSTTVTVAAGSIATSAVQHGCASVPACGVEGSTSASFGTVFGAAPAVLLQVQSLDSESGTPPSSASMPFLTASIVEDAMGNPIISTTGFDLALERSETQQGTVVAETVGWLAVAPTSACTTLDFSSFGGPASVPFEAVVTAEVIDGWSNGCNAGEGASFSAGCFAASPVVVATKRSRNEDDGGWLRRCTAGFSGAAVRFTVDEDRNSGGGNQGDGERGHVDESASVVALGIDFSTPVTLDSFHARAISGDTVRFGWTTATEVGNVGFDLFAVTDRGWQRLTSSPVPSAQGGVSPQSYEIELPTTATAFGISAIDFRGRRQDHGPFTLGQHHGARHPRAPIDWQAIRDADQGLPGASEYGLARPRAGAPEALDVHVSQTGLYRIGHDALVAAGVDFSGVPVASIALRGQGRALPRRVEPSAPGAVFGPGSAVFGPGGFVEFHGQAIEGSLYTRTNRYRIEIDSEAALPIARTPAAPGGDPPPVRYIEPLLVREDRGYSFASPTGDPWYDRRLLAFTTPVSETIPLPVDALAEGSATLRIVLWGGTDFPSAPDHHVIVRLNDTVLIDRTFDGLEAFETEVTVSGDLLFEGDNLLTLTVQGDTGVPFDVVHLESVELRYPRRFVAQGNALAFRASGATFDVEGFEDDRLVAYRLGDGRSRRPALLPVEVLGQPGGRYRARFPGQRRGGGDYVVTSVDRLLVPDALIPSIERAIPAGPAELLIVAHPRFLEGLEPLAEARRSEGYSVLVVDVESVYHRYSHDIVDPAAIRAFIADAVATRGTEYVLLVGGDTNDPLDHTGVGSMSFVPTPYVQTDDIARFTPADALLVDLDGDAFPDLPIGRLPVRTPEELDIVVAKTLRYASMVATHAVFAADGEEPMVSFGAISDRVADQLPAEFDVTRVYLDELEPVDARAALLAALADSPSVVSYVGHSGPGAWTFDGLLDVDDVASLTNVDPMVVFQWGCWNTYHVDPFHATLGHGFLLNPAGGAAAVLGASTLTTVESERLLGPLVLEALAEGGVPIGRAVQSAKEKLRAEHPDRLDVLLGWTLLGDPTLVVFD